MASMPLTRIRSVLRNPHALGLEDRLGASARLQWMTLVVLADRADCVTGEIPERFSPTAAELGELLLSDERTMRRILAALSASKRIAVQVNPGRRPGLRVLWPTGKPLAEEQETGEDDAPPSAPPPPSDPGQDARPTPGSVSPRAGDHPGQEISPPRAGDQPPPGMVSAHPGQEISPHPYVDLRSGVTSGVTCGSDPDPAAPDRSEETPVQPPLFELAPPSRLSLVEQVIAHWLAAPYHRGRVLSTPKRVARVKARLAEGFTAEDLMLAIDGAALDPWLMGTDPRSTKAFKDIETILRDAGQVEQLRERVRAQRATGRASPPPLPPPPVAAAPISPAAALAAATQIGKPRLHTGPLPLPGLGAPPPRAPHAAWLDAPVGGQTPAVIR